MTATTKTPKAVNYTAEQTAAMLAAYTAAPTVETVEQIAADLGKSVRSIVAKLSREGVYKKKEYIAHQGEQKCSENDHCCAEGQSRSRSRSRASGTR